MIARLLFVPTLLAVLGMGHAEDTCYAPSYCPENVPMAETEVAMTGEEKSKNTVGVDGHIVKFKLADQKPKTKFVVTEASIVYEQQCHPPGKTHRVPSVANARSGRNPGDAQCGVVQRKAKLVKAKVTYTNRSNEQVSESSSMEPKGQTFTDTSGKCGDLVPKGTCNPPL